MSYAATLSPAAPRPAHIPERAVYDFDIFPDPAFLADPQQAFSPKAMLALKDDMRALPNQLIDSVIARGRCDFMIDIADTLWLVRDV